MLSQLYQLPVERTDKAKNMARFYTMEIQPTLFDEVSLTRRWGRIGTSGQRVIGQFEREEDAVMVFLTLAEQRQRVGYSYSAVFFASDPKGLLCRTETDAILLQLRRGLSL